MLRNGSILSFAGKNFGFTGALPHDVLGQRPIHARVCFSNFVVIFEGGLLQFHCPHISFLRLFV